MVWRGTLIYDEFVSRAHSELRLIAVTARHY
jgi:hypothetical protein